MPRQAVVQVPAILRRSLCPGAATLFDSVVITPTYSSCLDLSTGCKRSRLPFREHRPHASVPTYAPGPGTTSFIETGLSVLRAVGPVPPS